MDEEIKTVVRKANKKRQVSTFWIFMRMIPGFMQFVLKLKKREGEGSEILRCIRRIGFKFSGILPEQG